MDSHEKTDKDKKIDDVIKIASQIIKGLYEKDRTILESPNITNFVEKNFSNEKGVVGTGYGTPSLNFFDLSVRDRQMFEWLNRIPYGHAINADGTLRQIR